MTSVPDPATLASRVGAEQIDSWAGLIEEVGLDAVCELDELHWRRDLERLDERTSPHGARIETYAGVLDADGPVLVLAHLAREAPDAEVIGAMVNCRELEAADGPYVGPDGHLTRGAFESAVATFENAIAARGRP